MAVRRDVARRRLGELIGPYGVFSSVGGSTTTVQYTSPFQSTEVPSDAYAYQWIYIPVTQVVRRITLTGTDGSTGTLTADGGLGKTIVSGDKFELSAKLPPARDSSPTVANSNYLGLNECIDLACRHLLIDDDTYTTLTLVSGQRSYPLTSYKWLTRADRLVDVRTLDALGSAYVSTHHKWELREAGNASAVFFPDPFRFSSGSYTARLVCRRPAWTLVNVLGLAWTASTTGMTNESDEVDLDLDNELIPVALVFAYGALRDRSRGETREMYDALYQRQLRIARRLKNYDTTNDIDPSVPAEAPAPVSQAA